MHRILVVDDEKIEREGLKFLLSLETQEFEIHEAANGKQALEVLREHPVDLVFTDIKMPHMDGLELAKAVQEKYPDTAVVIFSGYSDFSFAQQAIRHGVTDYMLKPIDPEKFHEMLMNFIRKMDEKKVLKMREEKEKNFLSQYFLQNYLYSGKKEVLEKAGELVDIQEWDHWRRAVMLETDTNFFDSAGDTLQQELKEELHRNFYYLNLGATQSLLFFRDVYCDYMLIANHIYRFLKRRYNGLSVRFYLGVSKQFEGCGELPGVLERLEELIEEKFYYAEKHIFSEEEEDLAEKPAESQDSQVMQKISEDISRKDADQIWKHFYILADKYRDNKKFSAMYVKFVFSSLIQELYREGQPAGEGKLEKEVERLYRCNNIDDILKITEENIRQFQEYVERSVNESRGEVTAVKNYIYQHYGENLGIEMLAEKVYLSSGYLSYIFKKETGMNLNRFIRVFRMEKAKELLCTTNMKVVQVSEAVGFSNVSYFCRNFREYYGISPESYRKGSNENEEAAP